MICSSLFQMPQCTTSLMIILYCHCKELEIIISWFKNNKMIVNPEKFQAIILDKQKHNFSNMTIKFYNKTIEIVSSVRLLYVELDNKLNLSRHVSNICKSAANQLSALLMPNNILRFEGKRVLLSSYFMSNFNYFPFVWMTSLKRIENLKIEIEELLDKVNSSTINIKRLHFLCVEI